MQPYLNFYQTTHYVVIANALLSGSGHIIHSPVHETLAELVRKLLEALPVPVHFMFKTGDLPTHHFISEQSRHINGIRATALSFLVCSKTIATVN